MALSGYDIDVDLANRPGTSHAMLVELVGSNKRVLDVGCATGYLGEAMTALGNHVEGFEQNPIDAAEARKKLARVEEGDLESVDLVDLFGRESFEVVVFGDVLEHLRNPLAVLRRSRPLLARGGSVLISTPNIAHGDVRLALLAGEFRYRELGILDNTHTHFFTRETLVEFLHDAGFVLAELRRTRAELFATEIGVVEGDFDQELVERLRADDEATTYQFVLRAVPDDATTLASKQALELDAANGKIHVAEAGAARLMAERDSLRAKVAELEPRVDALEARLAEVFAAHGAAVRDRDAARVTVAQLEERLQRELLAVQPQRRSFLRRAAARIGR
jgi:2-polyprenyl-3-methyl-5-hydroxy-6-metoxy-1,4-benzoquinol methylase